jgi:hypothetical protein
VELGRNTLQFKYAGLLFMTVSYFATIRPLNKSLFKKHSQMRNFSVEKGEKMFIPPLGGTFQVFGRKKKEKEKKRKEPRCIPGTCNQGCDPTKYSVRVPHAMD